VVGVDVTQGALLPCIRPDTAYPLRTGEDMPGRGLGVAVLAGYLKERADVEGLCLTSAGCRRLLYPAADVGVTTIPASTSKKFL